MELNETHAVRRTRRSLLAWVRGDERVAFGLLAPSLFILALFTFYPMLATLVNSFFVTNIAGVTTRFVGLANYQAVFGDPVFIQSLTSTLVYVLAVSSLTVLLALTLARLATMKLRHIGWVRTAFASTMGMSAAAASILWLFLFNPSVGQLPQLMQALGWANANPLADGQGAMVVVVLVSVWLHLGFAFLILLSALQSVPQDYYEVAEIAGVSSLKQTLRITVPMVSPTLFFLFVVEVIASFKSFAEIDLMTGGGPNNVTNLLAYKVYLDAFGLQKFGPASAEAIVLTGLIALATWVQFRFTERKVFYG
ncbi:carbohydrate ABC transporter permease [Lacticaseibacillus absianus]|uniref:carbohydrate ABC transporter permease n=1 Tax=Lacticaseibacillus absianus TaxID=2729623 RepID=UPI0015CC9BFB|nr:sugar ABC transporter permease [Lacticaseibacillus absianus]